MHIEVNMSYHSKHKSGTLSIMEAVETLSSLAEIDSVQDIAVQLEKDKVASKRLFWLKERDGDGTIAAVKEVFHVVLDYLRNYYKEDYQKVHNDRAIDRISTIMLLVGEAAKKLDRFLTIFDKTKSHSITQLKEYQDLQKFYQNRISKKVDDGKLSKWILGLAHERERQAIPIAKEEEGWKTKYIFVDLDAVKKDSEYELFYLKKEDGTRFFSPRLVRSMKLVCDFSSYPGQKADDDPLESMVQWQDRCLNVSAASILRSMGARLDHYFREVSRYRNHELVSGVNKAIMALYLCSYPENLLRNHARKSCSEYFHDFQLYLSEAMNTQEYHKLITYPPNKNNHFATILKDVIHALCRGMVIHMRGYHEMAMFINNLLHEAIEGDIWSGINDVLSTRLSKEYDAMADLLKRHANGPLKKTIAELEEGNCSVFKPIDQVNYPLQLYSLFLNDKRILALRLPSPTIQEYIHKVRVVDEFSGYLRACQGDHVRRVHLLINMQDRTSWKEFARCQALENLQKSPENQEHLSVVTLMIDTEFYHQMKPYNEDNIAEQFMMHFYEHLFDEASGCYFPESIRKELFPNCANELMHAVHRIFFNGRNVLTRAERMDFIEIYYQFLMLKLIDIVQPDSFSMTCKDGVDIGQAHQALMFIFLKFMHQKQLSHQDIECINFMLFAPSLSVRERVMLHDRFQRMISVLKRFEEARDEFGVDNFSIIIKEVFEIFYKTPILNAQAIPLKE